MSAMRWIGIVGGAWVLVSCLAVLAFGRIVHKDSDLDALSGVRPTPPPTPRPGPVAPPAPGQPPLPPDVAIVLHGLIGSSAVVVGGLEVLQAGLGTLAPADQQQLIESIRRQAAMTHRLLSDLFSAAPPELARALEELAATQVDYHALLTEAAEGGRPGD